MLLGEENFPEISNKSDTWWCKEMIYLRISSMMARWVRRSSFSSFFATSLRRSEFGFLGAMLTMGSWTNILKCHCILLYTTFCLLVFSPKQRNINQTPWLAQPVICTVKAHAFVPSWEQKALDQRTMQTNKTNNEHKIDLFTSAPLVSSGALATGSSNLGTIGGGCLFCCNCWSRGK